MPVPPSPLPSTLATNFSVGEALAIGISRRRLRATDLTSPFHGERRALSDVERENAAIAEDSSPLAKARAISTRLWSKARSYMEVAPAGAFICGRSAAAMRLYPVSAGDDIDVAVFGPLRAPRSAGVNGRRVEPHLALVEVIDGIPITTPAATWAMLARELSVRQLIELGDAVVRVPRDGFGTPHPDRAGATLDQLQEMIEAGRRLGVQKLLAAHERIRVGSSSPLETGYRLDAEDAGLPEPELDVEVCDERGRRIGISEFAYRKYRLAIEVEGDHHRTSKAQWNRDLQKYRDYADAGWEVVRLTHNDISVRRTATDIVRRALLRRGWRPVG